MWEKLIKFTENAKEHLENQYIWEIFKIFVDGTKFEYTLT